MVKAGNFPDLQQPSEGANEQENQMADKRKREKENTEKPGT